MSKAKDQKIRALVRALAGAHKNCKIQIDEEAKTLPYLGGEKGKFNLINPRWITNPITKVRDINYRVTYSPSTLTVVVGQEFVDKLQELSFSESQPLEVENVAMGNTFKIPNLEVFKFISNNTHYRFKIK